MLSARRWLLLIFVLSLLFAGKLPVAVPQNPDESPGNVAGTVRDQLTGQPLANVPVQISHLGKHYNTCTGIDGQYLITGVIPNAPFRIRAGGQTCDHTANYAYEFWQEKVDWGLADMLDLTAENPNLTGIDFTLERGGTVSGIVTDEQSGQPLAGVFVGLWYQIETGLSQGVGSLTDAAGKYTVYGVHLDIPVKAHAFSNSTLPSYGLEYWQEATWEGAATPITLTGDMPDLGNINFTLTPSGTVRGRVTDALTGEPLAYVSVHNYFVQPHGGGTCTDADGYYLLSGVPYNMPFRVTVPTQTCDGLPLPYEQEYWQEVHQYNDATLLTVTANTPELTEINFTMSPGGIVSGRVMDATSGQPLANISVDLYFDGYQMNTCTDETGAFARSGISLGRSFLMGAGSRRCDNQPHNYSEELWEETPNRANATWITLTPEMPRLEGLQFTLGTGGTISGQVVDAVTGQGIPAVVVNADFSGYGSGACTDANGNYTIQGIQPGLPFRLSAGGGFNFCGGASNYIMEFWQEKARYHEADMLTIMSDNLNLVGYNFSLVIGGSISGQVIDPATGAGLPNIGVNIESDTFGAGGCTDQNGYYHIQGVALNTPVQVVAGGGSWCGNNTNYRREYWQEAEFPHNAAALTLTAEMPELGGINFSLEVGGSISGRVLDQVTGQPLPHMPISTDYPWVGACTDDNGDYFISGVPLNIPIVISSGGMNWCGGAGDYLQEFWQEQSDPMLVSPITLTPDAPDAGSINFTLVTQPENLPPTLTLDQPAVTAVEGQVATLTGTAFDPNGNPLLITAPFGTVTVNENGTWQWSAALTDDMAETVIISADDGLGGIVTQTFTLTVSNAVPQVFAGGDVTLAMGLPLLVQATFSDPGTLDSHTATLDFGSGAVAAPVSGFNITGTFTYLVMGTYEITVCVTDNNGGVGCDSLLAQVTAQTVSIDIKPGSTPNSINLGSNGVVPVAIFSSSTFDATRIDPLSVLLAGAQIQLRGKGKPAASVEDVNQDGLPDLVVHVETEALQLSATDTLAQLSGNTVDGIFFMGSDSINVVPSASLDTDGDGLGDGEDSCPLEAGANSGCP